jgi:hypothetical protein
MKPIATLTERKMTLAQMFTEWATGKRKVPVKDVTPLPDIVPPFLTMRVGSFIEIMGVTRLAGRNLSVEAVRVYHRSIGGKDFPFIDYLLHDGVDANEIWATLRVIPVADPPRYSTNLATLLVLQPHLELQYNDVVKDLVERILPGGEITPQGASGTFGTYRRVEGFPDPYLSEVTIITDHQQPPERETLKYWDFARTDGDGPELYFVEFNPETGVVRTYGAEMISATDVLPMPAKQTL